MTDRITQNSKLLEKALDAVWLRNETISQNITNVDTPGYKLKTVAFKEYLSNAVENGNIKRIITHKHHIPIGETQIDEVNIKITVDSSSSCMRIDGNNVDIHREMAELAKKSIKYNTLIQSMRSEFSIIAEKIQK